MEKDFAKTLHCARDGKNLEDMLVSESFPVLVWEKDEVPSWIRGLTGYLLSIFIGCYPD